MSVFIATEVNCPICGASVTFGLVHSVNVDRRAVLRDEILGRSFQRETCSSCEHTFQIEPSLSYVDLGRKQWFAARPASTLARWNTEVDKASMAFARSFGAEAPPEAKTLGDGLLMRVVFGWEALIEKIVAAEAGIDDVTLECTKLALLRTIDPSPVGSDDEVRLLGTDGETLVFGVFATGVEQLRERLQVPADAIAEVEADTEAWQPLRDDLAASPFVDILRLVLDPVKA